MDRSLRFEGLSSDIRLEDSETHIKVGQDGVLAVGAGQDVAHRPLQRVTLLPLTAAHLRGGHDMDQCRASAVRHLAVTHPVMMHNSVRDDVRLRMHLAMAVFILRTGEARCGVQECRALARAAGRMWTLV